MPPFTPRFNSTACAHALKSVLLVAAAVLAAPVWAAKGDAPAPVILQPGVAPSAETAAALEVTDVAALKGIKRVAVNSFTVVFVSGDAATAAADKTAVTVRYELQGVGAPDFQAITDQAYEGFLAELRSAGYDVLDSDALKAHPAFAKLQAGGQPSGLRRDSLTAMAPAGLTVPPLATTALIRDSGLGAALSGLSAVGSTISAATDMDALARGLDATLIDVTAVVDFAQLKASGGGMWGRLTGSNAVEVTSKAAARLTHGVTTLRLYTPAQKGSVLTLSRPLLLADDTIAEVTQRNSGSTTAGNIAGALLSAAIGGGSRSSSLDYQAIAKPEAYRLRVGEGLTQLRAAFLARLSAGS